MIRIRQAPVTQRGDHDKPTQPGFGGESAAAAEIGIFGPAALRFDPAENGRMMAIGLIHRLDGKVMASLNLLI